ncbi:NTP transferase domain-containing protein [Acidianus sulfidivorans JP7]|uniref:Mannose-1-phosphate guanylyltransferase n=1 Tax=Acidianus sulfidivorans JP7 TaxID=619593 RepID=A0A2U9INQ0_9CREN|nr:NDP-sugar synthase [Acidianus sulfidivorans]AWR97632.1 NTP transferase domain-containing protein [Acidianus sulfidivorans JP7]
MVSAVILAGGYATRLRPLSLTKPKVLFPVLGKPILYYILENLEKAGINDIYISLRVMADKVTNYLESTEKKVTPIIEKDPLGDAGGLKYVSQKVNLDDTILVIYGDIYSEVNYKDLIEFHLRHDCKATMVATEVEDPRRYGVLLTEDEKIIEIIEKPKNPVSNLINAGVYVFNKDVLQLIQGESISKNFIPRILAKDCISVYKYSGVWADIGTPKDYMRLNFELLSKRYPKGYIAENAHISENATLIPPFLISENSIVKDGAYIDSNSILGNNVSVQENTYVGESLVMDNASIGSNSYLNGVIVADKCKIGKWNYIAEGSILGEEVTTHNGILINRNTIILPNKEVTESIYKENKIIL